MVKSIIEILERYQPNVILVEETVSRDIQESILKKGWTLVFDMKKHRLERVALCTVSPTLSSEILSGHKLRQCDSFHFQRFVEEHDTSADGGKRPSKTLMFIEGCPTHLGCTVSHVLYFVLVTQNIIIGIIDSWDMSSIVVSLLKR